MEVEETRVRRFEPSDAPRCARVLYDAVHQLTGRFYTEEQRLAWAPEIMSPDVFLRRLEGQIVLVAEDAEGVAGFMSYRPPTELDFAYVRPDCAGRGVAFRLHDALLQRARDAGAVSLSTSASEAARCFFERQGWKVEMRHDFERQGISMHNYRMAIEL